MNFAITWLKRVPVSLLLLVLMCLLLGLLQPRFFASGNLLNIGRNASILALASFGQAIVIFTGGIDLSAGAAVALISVVMVLAVFELGVPLAFLLGLLAGILIGSLNGLLVARFRLQPFLATLGTLTAMQGLASFLVGGLPMEAPSGGFRYLGSGTLAGVPVSIWIGFAGYALFHVLVSSTILGRAWYLIGSSQRAADSAGIRTRWNVFLAYVAAGAFTGLAGLILASRVNSAQPHLEPTLAFEAIAVCALGGIPLSGGFGKPYQVVIGALLLAVIENGLQLLNLHSNLQLGLIGLLTITAVAAQNIAHSPKERRR